MSTVQPMASARPARPLRLLARALLALALAIFAIWPFSMFRFASLTFHPGAPANDARHVIWIANGALEYERPLLRFRGDSFTGTSLHTGTHDNPVRWWPHRESAWTRWFVSFPLWIIGLTLLLFAAALHRWERTGPRRARAGLCAACGYDRRGLAESAPCPECGAAVL